jgi:hypothetical protein
MTPHISTSDHSNNSAPVTPEPEIPPFHTLRLRQDYHTPLSGKKVITQIPIRKPGKQEYVQVRPGEDWHLATMVLTIDEDRETFLVAPHLHDELTAEIRPVLLLTTMARQGVLFLWPAKLPSADGRTNPWTTSAMECAQLAMHSWVRVQPNQALGAYEAMVAASIQVEPEWPDLTFEQVLSIAFKGTFIKDLEHPAVRRLRGEL